MLFEVFYFFRMLKEVKPPKRHEVFCVIFFTLEIFLLWQREVTNSNLRFMRVWFDHRRSPFSIFLSNRITLKFWMPGGILCCLIEQWEKCHSGGFILTIHLLIVNEITTPLLYSSPNAVIVCLWVNIFFYFVFINIQFKF